MRGGPVLDEVEALPGSAHGAAAGNRDRERGVGYGGTDVRRHVVRPLRVVDIEPAILRCTACKEGLPVAPDVGVAVPLDQTARRRWDKDTLTAARRDATRADHGTTHHAETH